MQLTCRKFIFLLLLVRWCPKSVIIRSNKLTRKRLRKAIWLPYNLLLLLITLSIADWRIRPLYVDWPATLFLSRFACLMDSFVVQINYIFNVCMHLNNFCFIFHLLSVFFFGIICATMRDNWIKFESYGWCGWAFKNKKMAIGESCFKRNFGTKNQWLRLWLNLISLKLLLSRVFKPEKIELPIRSLRESCKTFISQQRGVTKVPKQSALYCAFVCEPFSQIVSLAALFTSPKLQAEQQSSKWKIVHANTHTKRKKATKINNDNWKRGWCCAVVAWSELFVRRLRWKVKCSRDNKENIGLGWKNAAPLEMILFLCARSLCCRFFHFTSVWCLLMPQHLWMPFFDVALHTLACMKNFAIVQFAYTRKDR